jgi:CRP-like cAMP-binding protein
MDDPKSKGTPADAPISLAPILGTEIDRGGIAPASSYRTGSTRFHEYQLDKHLETLTQTGLRDPTLGTANRFLTALPPDELKRLWPHLHSVSFAQGQNLVNLRAPIEHVYFPERGLISLTHRLKDGSSIDVAMMGRETVVGALEAVGGDIMLAEAVVLIRGSALRMSVAQLQAEAQRSPVLCRSLHRHHQALFIQVLQSAACHARHMLDQQLARCLLTAQDCMGGDELPLSHENLAMMLGRRRAGVTVAASGLRAAGIIHNRRGRITILDRPALESEACECYEAVRSQQLRLLSEE